MLEGWVCPKCGFVWATWEALLNEPLWCSVISPDAINKMRTLLSHIAQLESQLSKWTAEHEDQELQWMKEQSQQSSLGAKQAYINALEWRVKHLESQKEELEKKIIYWKERYDIERKEVVWMEAKIKELELQVKDLEKQKALIPWIGELAQARVRVKQLTEGIEKIIMSPYVNSLVIKERLSELVEKK